MSEDLSWVGEVMKTSVPWVGTAGVEFEEVTAERVVATLPDVENLRNHVGGPHAAMIFGLGETASGAVVTAAFNQQFDRAVPLPTNAEIRYRKIALGAVRAEAVIERAAADVIAELDAGVRPDIPVRVTLSNAEGVTTGELTVNWTLRPNR